MNFASHTVDRLIQEHAIYKNLFLQLSEPPKNNPAASQLFLPAKLYEVIKNLKNLDDNIPYHDPTWANANQHLFTIISKGFNSI